MTLSEAPNTDLKCWVPRLDTEAEKLMPIEDLKEVYIGSRIHQVMEISTLLSAMEERELVDQLIKHVDLFA